jgi:hypothetical protein
LILPAEISRTLRVEFILLIRPATFYGATRKNRDSHLELAVLPNTNNTKNKSLGVGFHLRITQKTNDSHLELAVIDRGN